MTGSFFFFTRRLLSLVRCSAGTGIGTCAAVKDASLKSVSAAAGWGAAAPKRAMVWSKVSSMVGRRVLHPAYPLVRPISKIALGLTQRIGKFFPVRRPRPHSLPEAP